ncbi:hypothetical protein AALC17_17285 [Oscillospiraceae bacterium 38-13]
MKNLKSFFSGIFVAMVVMALTGTALAAAGKLQVGTGGIIVMDQVKVNPGEEYTVDGQKIPAVVAYTDVSGKAHDYVPVAMITDYLDIPTSWSEKRNSVVLGPSSEGVEYIITSGVELNKSIVNSPVFGTRVGPLTEVDPKAVDTSEGPLLIIEDETKVETYTGFSTGVRANAMHGKHLLLTITNNGTAPIVSRAGRAYTLNGYEGLSKVKIEPGQTLTRAFAVDDEVDRIRNNFVSSIIQYDGSEKVQATVSLMQYQ